MSLRTGHGHLQAAKAKHEEMRLKFPEARIILRDVMIDWLGKYAGGFLTWMWNHGQRTGNMALLEFCVSGQKFCDKLLWVPIFFSMLATLLKQNVDTVIDTQILGTSAILKALRCIHYWKGKKILLEKVITDLPTDNTSLYFSTIKKLAQKDKKYLKIFTTTPLLNERAKDPNAFWKQYCNLTESDVVYDSLPIRPAFLYYAGRKPSDLPLTINISTSNPHETHLIHRAISFGHGKAKRMKNIVAYTIDPKDKVTLLMLGANPHEEAIIQYIGHFVEMLQERKYKERKDHLFVTCSKQEKIVELLEKTKNYPTSLTIIPLPYQEDRVIAPLFQRSNATLTRSGGLTSMELLTVSQGIIWIHKGSPPKHLPRFFLRGKTLREGMPPWERGNAKYLQVKKGAEFITPQTFKEVAGNYFSEETEAAFSSCLSTSGAAT